MLCYSVLGRDRVMYSNNFCFLQTSVKYQSKFTYFAYIALVIHIINKLGFKPSKGNRLQVPFILVIVLIFQLYITPPKEPQNAKYNLKCQAFFSAIENTDYFL